MLKKILDKSTCAKCRLCCSFVKSDAWETPVFTKTDFDYNENWFKKYGYNSHTLKLEFKDDAEIKLCPYLNENTGCTLSEADKPFDCKIWPLRLMKKNGRLVIALAPICKGLGEKDITKINELLDSGLYEEIMKHAGEADIIKEYNEEYILIK